VVNYENSYEYFLDTTYFLTLSLVVAVVTSSPETENFQKHLTWKAKIWQQQ